MKKEYERAELEIVLVGSDVLTASRPYLPPWSIEEEEEDI